MRHLLLLLLMPLLAAGEALDPAVAVVGGEVITESRLDAGIPRARQRADLAHARRDRLDQLIGLLAVGQHLARLGASAPAAAVEARMRELRAHPPAPTCGCHDQAASLEEYLAHSFLSEDELRQRVGQECAIELLAEADWQRLHPDAASLAAARRETGSQVRRVWTIAVEAGADEPGAPRRGERSWSKAAEILAGLRAGEDAGGLVQRHLGETPSGPDPGRIVSLAELARLGVPAELAGREPSGLLAEPLLSERRWLVTRWQLLADDEVLVWMRSSHRQRFADELQAAARAAADVRRLGVALQLPR